MALKFRPLSAEEIRRLTGQGCSCSDWANVQAAEGFDPARVKSTHFSGSVKLGVFEKDIPFFGGVTKPAGISNATIHNCTIGNNVYINQIRNYIANYYIEDDVIIENVDLLAVEGSSCFGNGTEVTVLNEGGGREIPIYDHLSAQLAYVIAVYRHRPKVIENLRKMVADYTSSVTSSMGVVASRAKLISCRTIKNVKIGPDSHLEGVDRLENGSINSCRQDPVYIGQAVSAEDFIICSGSKITDGTIISKCFVGQGCVLASRFSAENSVFFANCECFQGEACSIFAGPYTVTHHKSTLLIAGLFSFLNAGSQTNQSNHTYKLGPVHQGVMERGCKTASGSYMLWPAKIGAFSVVIGRHYGHPDTSDLPFSYLTESDGKSVLVPGANLRSVGAVRDAQKWPKRDRRKDARKLDYINFKLLSPYTIQKIRSALELLINLKATSDETVDYLTCHNVRIKSLSLGNGIKLYQMSIEEFVGDCLIKQLENRRFETIDELRAAMSLETHTGMGKWLDMAGLLAPQDGVQKMLGCIENGTISTLEQMRETFQAMYDNYQVYEWAWTAKLLQERMGKAVEKITADDVVELVTKWKTAVEKSGSLLRADAQKEFADNSRIGYGLDGTEETKDADFKAVRGTLEENSFVSEIEESVNQKTSRADGLIRQLKKLR